MIDANYICLVAGPIIALLVSVFKSMAIVAEHPKVFAAILSVVFAIVSGLTFEPWGEMLDWPAIAQCLIVPFSTAVASFEVVKSATRRTP